MNRRLERNGRARFALASFFALGFFVLCRRLRRSDLFFGIDALHKALNLPGGVDDALLTREEGVTFVADIGVNFFFS